MQRLGGAVTRMQQTLNDELVLKKIFFLLGDIATVKNISQIAGKQPFDKEIIAYLDEVSKIIMKDPETKHFSDVVTFAFWIRKASVENMKKKYYKDDENVHLGRGVVFHIAPSNVPINYAYSLVLGLLTGNANIVKIPTKEFPQISIINKAFKQAFFNHSKMKDYICLIRYNREIEVTNYLSYHSDVRVIWGGDSTVSEIRKSPLFPRATEITFADRYSFAIINSDSYLEARDKSQIAENFYNDTYLTDQNACTSPKLIVWTGNKIEEAKIMFWEKLHVLVRNKYTIQAIQSVNKLSSAYLFAINESEAKIERHEDNLIIRVMLQSIKNVIMEYECNSGFFFEYDCSNILELKELCNCKRCQTIGYIGNKENILPLINSGIKGVDRIVPIGKTMDFEFLWDGYNLYERLTRVIRIRSV